MDEEIGVAKSCVDCIFRIPRKQVLKEYGVDYGADVCGMYGRPLTLPAPTTEEWVAALESQASDCEHYANEGARPSPRSLSIEGSKVFDAISPDGAYRTPPGVDLAPDSCLSCRWFVPPQDAADAALWPVGICAANAMHVTPRRYRSQAADCAVGAVGRRDVPSLLDMLTLGEHYQLPEALSFIDDSISEGESMARTVEPKDYPTDRPVDATDAAAGVRAWMRVTNPANRDQSAFLPIFREDYFTAADRAAIPQSGDDEHPEEYVDHLGLVYKTAVLWTELNETPSLVGQAGTGKTEFFRHMAWLMQLPFHRISVTASTEVEDLAGKMHYSPERGTFFEYGRIPLAWMKAGVICLDEPNVGPPDVWQFIRPLTDNSKQLVLDMNNGERVARHRHAFLGMAMNPAWDIKNSGTATLADADGSRLMHIFVDLPTPKVESKIISDRVKLDGWELSESQVAMIMGIAEDLRDLCNNDTLPITWGIRPQIKVARALRWFTPEQAYRLAAADYLEPAHQGAIMDVVKAHVPPAPIKAEEPRRIAPRIRTRAEREGWTARRSGAPSSGEPAKWRVE